MSGRNLTGAEIELCQGVFGDAIAYDQVRIFNRKWWLFQPRRVTMAPDGNLWFHPKGQLFCGDFCEMDLGLRGLFIHEMVHVWQHQKGIFLPLARHPFCRYAYQLVPGKKLEDYGIEQQAEIIRHIFLLRNGARLTNGLTLDDFEKVLIPFSGARVAKAPG